MFQTRDLALKLQNTPKPYALGASQERLIAARSSFHGAQEVQRQEQKVVEIPQANGIKWSCGWIWNDMEVYMEVWIRYGVFKIQAATKRFVVLRSHRFPQFWGLPGDQAIALSKLHVNRHRQLALGVNWCCFQVSSHFHTVPYISPFCIFLHSFSQSQIFFDCQQYFSAKFSAKNS